MDHNGTNRSTDRYGYQSGTGRTGSRQTGADRRTQQEPRREQSHGWAYPDDGGGIYSGAGGANRTSGAYPNNNPARAGGAYSNNNPARANGSYQNGNPARASGAYLNNNPARASGAYPNGNSARANGSYQNGNPTRASGGTDRRYGRAYESPNEARMRRAAEKRARRDEMLRRENEAKRKALRREAIKYNIILVLKLFAATFAVCAAAMAGLYFATFFGKEAKYPKVTYTYIDTQTKNVDSSLSYKNGVLYVNFTALAERLGMSVTGGAVRMKFAFPDNDGDDANSTSLESVEFETGSARIWINSQETRSESASVMRGESIWVPLSVVTDYMKGLEVKSDGKTVSIKRITAEGSTADEPIYEDVEFTLKDPSALASVDESEAASSDGDSAVEFTADLSQYEQYMNPDDRDSYLLLVNATNTLDESYIPDDLCDIADTRQDGRATQQMRLTASKAMEAMFIEMRAAGYTDVSVTSAYRSYTRQSELFSSYTSQEMANNSSLTKEEAEAIVVTYSNRPGTSEHQSGLAADLHNLSSADQSFAQTDAYKWLKENAWKFGFVERYPEDKTEVTGVSFEPWHYRFVGRYHALRMKQSGMCLEEYVESLN